MAAQIGPRDLGLLDAPRPELLREITGIEPEPDGRHVRLERGGFRSLQRLAIAELGGGVVAVAWPAELKPQAQYLYSNARAEALLAAARGEGCTIRPNPHVAFYNSSPQQRLYLDPSIDLEEYVRLWEGPDAGRIGEYPRAEVRLSLWPWLLERGYATADDEEIFEIFLRTLGQRPAHLRPGLHLDRRWTRDEVRGLSPQELGSVIRQSLNKVLQSVGEPPLPVGMSR